MDLWNCEVAVDAKMVSFIVLDEYLLYLLAATPLFALSLLMYIIINSIDIL